MYIAVSFPPADASTILDSPPDFLAWARSPEDAAEKLQDRFGQNTIPNVKSFYSGGPVNHEGVFFGRWHRLAETEIKSRWAQGEAPPDTIRIQVTLDDIRSQSHMCDTCPIALALIRLGYQPWVQQDFVVVNGRLYLHSTESYNFVIDYDSEHSASVIDTVLKAAN